MKYTILGSTLVLFVLIVGISTFMGMDRNSTTNATTEVLGFGNGRSAVVYKSPTCGCCVGYADELEKQGFDVEVVATEDMSKIKEQFGVPADKQSCHTIAIDDYVVEGHVPMEAVEKLLTESPDIEGIGLPRMPSGTPGMPGPKRAPYEVYQLSNGTVSSYVTI